ncbi:PspA/IM30 family protein [Arthrobacter methylotrophus]|uniref:PspA/IM30 family protein n=1 Tax=Arthrobacter methylotrophus TaxID=121291 RepID=A0ABV5UP74_9MICC
MMSQSIFGRVAQLAKANINDLLDRAEDPQKMLDQMVRDYSENISEAESAVAQTIGNLRLAEEDHNRAVGEAADWGNKALAASRKADGYRTAGNTADAEKFDNLAKVAIQRQMTAESTAKAQEPNLDAQTKVVEQLKQGLDQMKAKLGELTAKRNELVARSRTAAAQSQVNEALKSLDAADPTSTLGRFEDRIRREEATVRGQQELASSSLDAQFASLEDLGEQTEVEARLAALKSGATQQAAINS